MEKLKGKSQFNNANQRASKAADEAEKARARYFEYHHDLDIPVTYKEFQNLKEFRNRLEWAFSNRIEQRLSEIEFSV